MAPMPDDRPEPRDRGETDGFEEPYDGDVAHARDQERHKDYGDLIEGGRV